MTGSGSPDSVLRAKKAKRKELCSKKASLRREKEIEFSEWLAERDYPAKKILNTIGLRGLEHLVRAAVTPVTDNQKALKVTENFPSQVLSNATHALTCSYDPEDYRLNLRETDRSFTKSSAMAHIKKSDLADVVQVVSARKTSDRRRESEGEPELVLKLAWVDGPSGGTATELNVIAEKALEFHCELMEELVTFDARAAEEEKIEKRRTMAGARSATAKAQASQNPPSAAVAVTESGDRVPDVTPQILLKQTVSLIERMSSGDAARGELPEIATEFLRTWEFGKNFNITIEPSLKEPHPTHFAITVICACKTPIRVHQSKKGSSWTKTVNMSALRSHFIGRDYTEGKRIRCSSLREHGKGNKKLKKRKFFEVQSVDAESESDEEIEKKRIRTKDYYKVCNSLKQAESFRKIDDYFRAWRNGFYRAARRGVGTENEIWILREQVEQQQNEIEGFHREKEWTKKEAPLTTLLGATAMANKDRKGKTGYRFQKVPGVVTYMKVIVKLTGPLGYQTIRAGVSPEAMMSYKGIRRLILKESQPIVEGEWYLKEFQAFVADAKKVDLDRRDHLVVISEDGASIKEARKHDPVQTGRVVGPVAFSGEQDLKPNGFPRYDELVCSSLSDLDDVMKQELANIAYVYMVRVAGTRTAASLGALMGTRSGYTMEEVCQRWIAAAIQLPNRVRLCFSADGDSKFVGAATRCYGLDKKSPANREQAMSVMPALVRQFGINHLYRRLAWQFLSPIQYDPVDLFIVEDQVHMAVKAKTRLLRFSHSLVCGQECCTLGDFILLVNRQLSKASSGLTLEQLNPKDKMNYRAVEMLITPVLLESMKECRMAFAYLTLMQKICSSFTKAQDIPALKRYADATFTLTFLRGWRADILLNGQRRGLTLNSHFVSSNLYQCVLINHVCATMSLCDMAARRAAGKDCLPFVGGVSDSQDCEHYFRHLRAETGYLSLMQVFSLYDMLQKARGTTALMKWVAELDSLGVKPPLQKKLSDLFHCPRVLPDTARDASQVTMASIEKAGMEGMDSALKMLSELGVDCDNELWKLYTFSIANNGGGFEKPAAVRPEDTCDTSAELCQKVASQSHPQPTAAHQSHSSKTSPGSELEQQQAGPIDDELSCDGHSTSNDSDTDGGDFRDGLVHQWTQDLTSTPLTREGPPPQDPHRGTGLYCAGEFFDAGVGLGLPGPLRPSWPVDVALEAKVQSRWGRPNGNREVAERAFHDSLAKLPLWQKKCWVLPSLDDRRHFVTNPDLGTPTGGTAAAFSIIKIAPDGNCGFTALAEVWKRSRPCSCAIDQEHVRNEMAREVLRDPSKWVNLARNRYQIEQFDPTIYSRNVTRQGALGHWLGQDIQFGCTGLEAGSMTFFELELAASIIGLDIGIVTMSFRKEVHDCEVTLTGPSAHDEETLAARAMRHRLVLSSVTNIFGQSGVDRRISTREVGLLFFSRQTRHYDYLDPIDANEIFTWAKRFRQVSDEVAFTLLDETSEVQADTNAAKTATDDRGPTGEDDMLLDVNRLPEPDSAMRLHVEEGRLRVSRSADGMPAMYVGLSPKMIDELLEIRKGTLKTRYKTRTKGRGAGQPETKPVKLIESGSKTSDGTPIEVTIQTGIYMLEREASATASSSSRLVRVKKDQKAVSLRLPPPWSVSSLGDELSPCPACISVGDYVVVENWKSTVCCRAIGRILGFAKKGKLVSERTLKAVSLSLAKALDSGVSVLFEPHYAAGNTFLSKDGGLFEVAIFSSRQENRPASPDDRPYLPGVFYSLQEVYVCTVADDAVFNYGVDFPDDEGRAKESIQESTKTSREAFIANAKLSMADPVANVKRDAGMADAKKKILERVTATSILGQLDHKRERSNQLFVSASLAARINTFNRTDK